MDEPTPIRETRPRRRPLARLRAVLAERSRRGRVASYVLAAVVVGAAAGLLIWRFPHRSDVRLELGIAGVGAEIPVETPIAFWPGSGVTVAASGLTDGGKVALAIDGRRLRVVRADARGEVGTRVTLPLDTTPGSHAVELRDAGSGRVGRSVEIVVRDPASPSIDAQPRRAAPGAPLAVRGGGLAPGGRVVVALVGPDGAVVELARPRVRGTGLVGVATAAPGAAAPGSYRVVVRDAGGHDLAPPAPLELVAA